MDAEKTYSFEELLEKQGKFVWRTSGRSMRPLIRQGKDLVVIRKPQGRLKKYDVALYRRQTGNYVLHRVVRVLPDGYIIRGDNCFCDETDITDAQIVGVLTQFQRRGKQISTDAPGYRLYARLWVFSYPLRVFLHMTKGFLTEGLWVHLRNRKNSKK